MFSQSTYKSIHDFNTTLNNLEITDSAIYVSNYNLVFYSTDKVNWDTLIKTQDFSDTLRIYDLKYFNDSIYLATNGGFVTKSGDSLREVFSTGNPRKLNIFKKSLVFQDELYYSSIYQLKEDRTLNNLGRPSNSPFNLYISCDDSIIFAGYDGNNTNGGGYIYNSQSNSWSAVSLLVNKLIQESTVKEGQIIAFIGYSYEKIFISFDYGTTGIIKDFPLPLGYYEKHLATHNGVIYVGSSEGIYYSKDTATSWNTLTDVYVEDMVIKDDILYGVTEEGIFFEYNLNPDTAPDEISGTIFLDTNENGIQDSGENGINGQLVKLEPGEIYSSTDNDGKFSFTPTGEDHYLRWIPKRYHHLTTDSIGYTINYPYSNNSNYNFGLTIEAVEDASVYLSGTATRPGFNTQYYIHYINEGTVVNSQTISFKYDSALTYISSNYPPISHAENHLEWNIADLNGSYILLTFNLPSTTPLNSLLASSVQIAPSPTEVNATNNYDTLYQTVTGSFDPNDKLIQEGVTEKNYVLFDSPLRYTIRFQNTGTDTAFVVKVVDTLDINHSIETLEILGTSHEMKYSIEDRAISFVFDNIKLPDSTRDERNSHGFIKYRIKTKSNLTENTIVRNKADIYFDFNEPVRTNETINTFVGSIPKVYNDYSYSLCFGDSIKILHQWIKEPKEIKYTVKTYDALDTINTYVVDIKEEIKTIINDTIVEGDSLYFVNNWVKSEGSYSHVLPSKTTCDSTVILNLTITPPIIFAVNAPTELTTEGKEQSIALIWKDNSDNEDGFIIEKFIDNNIKFGIIDTVLSNISTYEDHSVTETKSQYYRIYAFNNSTRSVYSNVSSAQLNTITRIDDLYTSTINIFPNPSTGFFNVQLTDNSSQEVVISVTDYIGNGILRRKLTKEELQKGFVLIDLSSFQEGIFILSIDDTKALVNKKLIKK